MQNLDDPTQTSFYIPYQPQVDDQANEKLQEAYITAYRLSWAKCLTQLRSEIDRLYKPTVDAVVERISTAHEDVLPGLPYPELPLIAVHSSSSLFIDNLIPCLSTHNAATTVSHLFPSDAPNILTAMRSLISNLLDPSAIRKSKLAPYDIGILNAHFTPTDPLLIVLHDFEQFEPSVMQDVLYICSTRIPSLHLTFLAFLSSPSKPSSYIHVTYPRSTLTRLRVHSLSVQVGTGLLEELLLRTFFNPRFEPDVMLGPSAVEGIVDYYTRHNGSIDALITSIQLTYLKHFLTEPLSILVYPPSALTADQTYASVLSLLRSRIPGAASETLFDTFMQHSTTFRTASCALRLGFMILHKTSEFLVSNGYKPFQASHSNSSATTNLMLSTLRGQTAREIKTLAICVKKLRPDILHALLTKLHDVYPDGHDSAKHQVHLFLAQTVPKEDESEDELDAEEISTWFSEHLTSLLKPLTQLPLWDIYYTGSSPFPLDLLNPSPRAAIISALIRPYSFTAPLPLPATLNPSNSKEHEHSAGLRTSPTVSEIEAQLKSTHIPAQRDRDEMETNMPKELHNLPDTSILFARYLDSGKLINIYDWYESFKVCLDVQRAERISRTSSERTARKDKTKRRRKSRSPIKQSPAKTKGKGKAKAISERQEEPGMEMDVDVDVKVEEPNEESWQREVQARFVRALHELDYLGFVKHTGRKVEHVVKVVFDVGDGDDTGEGEEEDAGE